MPKLEKEILDLVRDGVFYPDRFISGIEHGLFRRMQEKLEDDNFRYISVPSIVSKDTYLRQGTVPWEKVFKIDDNLALAGSAEQGILEFYKGQHVDPIKLWAKNQCFRAEPAYEGLKYLREFIKLEQFIFCHEANALKMWNHIMTAPQHLLGECNIKFRTVDVTQRDPGYHLKKVDIEVWTETYGWLETHSCSYFGEEQTKRFDITGATHTLSNTAIASPRFLIPILER